MPAAAGLPLEWQRRVFDEYKQRDEGELSQEEVRGAPDPASASLAFFVSCLRFVLWFVMPIVSHAFWSVLCHIQSPEPESSEDEREKRKRKRRERVFLSALFCFLPLAHNPPLLPQQKERDKERRSKRSPSRDSVDSSRDRDRDRDRDRERDRDRDKDRDRDRERRKRQHRKPAVRDCSASWLRCGSLIFSGFLLLYVFVLYFVVQESSDEESDRGHGKRRQVRPQPQP